MITSRRRFFGMCAAVAAQAGAQTRPATPRAHTGPLICLDSRLVPEIEYSQFGTLLNAMGFDGCDLQVEAGGTVAPDQSPVDMVRAIEVITGEGFEVPVISTAFLSVAEPWARNVIGLCGRSGVVFFRTGYSRYPERMAQRRNDVAGLMSYGRAVGIGLVLPYPAAESIVGGIDPTWVGYDFDPSQGSLPAALPRVRTIVLRDTRKEGDRMVPCPLGEGTVNWSAFFGTLAHARFSGPLTLSSSYPAPDRLEAMRRDLAFARKLLNEAYQKELSSLNSAH
jgi:L-ribulose-5-phosphate 3-epimerase